MDGYGMSGRRLSSSNEKSTMTDVKIALALETSYLRHTMVAMLSVLRHATRPVRVYILGDSLSCEAKKVIEEGCRRSGAADLTFYDLEEILPSEHRLSSYWPRNILLRLHIPKLIDGRALYLDSDTCTFADISPLFEIDLGKNLIAASRDYIMLRAFNKHSKSRISGGERVRKMMRHFPGHTYFNSGVILFDCDGIRTDDGILSSLVNLAEAKNYDFPDMDHLNFVFKDRALMLHPQWNAFHGLMLSGVWLARNILPPEARHDLRKPKIIHYVGGPKPWEPYDIRWLQTKAMVKRLPRSLQYKFIERRLLAPHIAAIDAAVRSAGTAPRPAHV